MAERLAQAVHRLQRPEAVVCLGGEFKSGKSSLANALIGAAVCPVDDDLATAAITVVRHGDATELTIHRRDGGKQVAEHLPLSELPAWVAEGGNPGNRRGVEQAEVRLPNALLARGLTIVDTPGVGGLELAHAAATLGILPSADALLFGTEASAELSGPELDLLGQASQICPVVLVVLTKVDLFPEWRRIAAIDGRLLAALGLPAPVPVSAVLRAKAFERRDAELNIESGLPALLTVITREVLERRTEAAAGFAVAEAATALRQLRAPLEAEARAFETGRSETDTAERLAATKSSLAQLRGYGSRWMPRLNDGFAELASDVDHTFRGGMRKLQRAFDEELEQIDPASAWDELGGRLQRRTTDTVQEVYSRLIQGAQRVETSVLELLTGDLAASSTLRHAPAPDIGPLWTGRRFQSSSLKSRAGATFGAVRGAQGGILALGMVGSLVGLTFAGPILVAAAGVFGARQIAEDRRKQLVSRRQEARASARQFLDDVQFEVGARFRDLGRELHQQLREYFAERIEELQRTHIETARALEDWLVQDQVTRRQRDSEVNAQLAELEALSARLQRGRS